MLLENGVLLGRRTTVSEVRGSWLSGNRLVGKCLELSSGYDDEGGEKQSRKESGCGPKAPDSGDVTRLWGN